MAAIAARAPLPRGSGAPTDATFVDTNATTGLPSGAAVDGLEYFDGGSGVSYVRSNGSWVYTRPVGASDPITSPTGLIAESWHRLSPPGAVTDNNTPLTSGTLYCVGVVLPAGRVISKVQFLAGSTAEATGTHAWTALLDSALVCRAVSADNTGAAAVGASALFGAAFAATFTIPTTGLYFACINVTATTPPSLISAGSLAALTGLVPKLVGTSTTGLTAPITTGGSAQTALTATAAVPYVQVS